MSVLWLLPQFLIIAHTHRSHSPNLLIKSDCDRHHEHMHSLTHFYFYLKLIVHPAYLGTCFAVSVACNELNLIMSYACELEKEDTPFAGCGERSIEEERKCRNI